jgi:hypothetical protein
MEIHPVGATHIYLCVCVCVRACVCGQTDVMKLIGPFCDYVNMSNTEFNFVFKVDIPLKSHHCSPQGKRTVGRLKKC